MGLNAYVSGDLAAAERRFRRLREREGESIRALRDLGVVLAAKGDLAGARACFLREEELYGASFHRHAALADLDYEEGRREEALARYRAALGEKEAGGASNRRLLEERAAICSDPAAYERALLARARFREAEEARDEGRPEEALEAFEEAVGLDPSHWPALNNCGSLLLNVLGDPGRALELFERAAELTGSAQCRRNADLARRAIAVSTRGGKGGGGR
jgi:tetratricopeptide (TPR) repeat protein